MRLGPLACGLPIVIGVLAAAVNPGGRLAEAAPRAALDRAASAAEPAAQEAEAATARGPIAILPIRAALLPVTGDYLARALAEAAAADARLVLIELDTPGGLVTTVREMVTRILESPVPVAVYVSPSGASAASGGVFLVLAADIAAMAPVADMGAAHPVFAAGKNDRDSILLEKAENELAAFARSLAEKRGRNPEKAEMMVRESHSYSTEEALEAGFIEWVAADRGELLELLDGARIERPDGSAVVLSLEGATVETVSMTVREHVLSILSQPMVAFFLLAVGVLGIYAEITNPGTLLPGIVGIIGLLLFALASQVLPVNWTGVGLIGLGLGLLVLEAFVVSYGALSVGGIACIVIGALVLFDTPPELRLPRALLVSVAVGLGLIALFLARLAVSSQTRPPVTGRGALVGLQGEALTDLSPAGKVLVRGEYYDAFSEDTVPRGARVEILALEGRELRVRAAPQQPASARATERG